MLSLPAQAVVLDDRLLIEELLVGLPKDQVALHATTYWYHRACQLVDEGLLVLDESVEELLPELADCRVLVRQDGPLSETVPAQRPITCAIRSG